MFCCSFVSLYFCKHNVSRVQYKQSKCRKSLIEVTVWGFVCLNSLALVKPLRGYTLFDVERIISKEWFPFVSAHRERWHHEGHITHGAYLWAAGQEGLDVDVRVVHFQIVVPETSGDADGRQHTSLQEIRGMLRGPQCQSKQATIYS